MGNLGRRTAHGATVAVTGQLAQMVIQLGASAVMARLLAPKDFGLVAMALTVTGFVSIFTDLGLSTATIQRKELDQDTASGLFYLNLATGIVADAGCFCLGAGAAWLYGDDRVRWLIMAQAAAIPVSAAGVQHTALLQRNMRWVAIRSRSITRAGRGIGRRNTPRLADGAWLLGAGRADLDISRRRRRPCLDSVPMAARCRS